MTEQFDSWALQVYNGGWVDISSDVYIDPGISWNVGIMSNDLRERVGDPGRMTFILDNGASNSAGLLGYYSPDHANKWAGWGAGLLVRLLFYYDSNPTPYTKYYGWITPDGIEVSPLQYERRIVKVTCEDWMGQAARHYLNLMTYAQNLRVDQAIPLILANLSKQPYATSYATGIDTFPTIFDTTRDNTTALSELNKLALSEFGYIYCKSDGTLRFDARTTRSDSVAVPAIPKAIGDCSILTDESGNYLTDESGNQLVADETQTAEYLDAMSTGMSVSFGRNVINQVRSEAYPRKTDAAATTVLFALQKSFKLTAGQTITGYRGTYRDPSGASTRVCGFDMVTPLSGTDYIAFANEDGTGTNKTADLTVTATYGTEAVEYSLTAASELWVTTLQARGKGVYLYDTIQTIQTDAASQNTHGTKSVTLECRYQNDPTKTDLFSRYIISQNANPKSSIDACPIWANNSGVNMYGFLTLEPGDKVTVQETVTGVNGEYYIQGYKAQLVNGKHVLWTLVLTDNPGYYAFSTWDDGKWDSAIWG